MANRWLPGEKLSSTEVAAYLERIGISVGEAKEPSPELLLLLQRKHLSSVPFENLHIILSEDNHKVPQLEPFATFNKIVTHNRGGYCYELNGGYCRLLDALGFRVKPLLARISGEDTPYPAIAQLDHLVILVTLGESEYITDVGNGTKCIRSPIHLPTEGTPTVIPGHRLSCIAEGLYLLEWMSEDNTWTPWYTVDLKQNTYIPQDTVFANFHVANVHPLFSQVPLAVLHTAYGAKVITKGKYKHTHFAWTAHETGGGWPPVDVDVPPVMDGKASVDFGHRSLSCEEIPALLVGEFRFDYGFSSEQMERLRKHVKGGADSTLKSTQPSPDELAIKETVRDCYSKVCREFNPAKQEQADQLAQSFGYSKQDVHELGAGASMGLSCGNPVSRADLREGEVVLDLGAGAGFDLFLAAKRVGPSGRLIGVDYSADMVERARANAKKRGIANVDFHHAELERLPIADRSVDCVISNCVLNLVPDKTKAFSELFRVLKSGGRVVISDIVLRQKVPPGLAADIRTRVCCVGGALQAEEYESLLRQVGFGEVRLVDKNADLNVWKKLDVLPKQQQQQQEGSCCSTSRSEATRVSCCGAEQSDSEAGSAFMTSDLNQFASSCYIHALKP
ncbi:unnamed protein product [Vitrella brassicaformis CCMP3155]|uniref:Methyltransferase domain-containing protein n=1 Tax=Vitrella brassicaformis (strain CCMP3155) TaxID=1169540 RepID=A0A0G4GL81_VITBC|nr:unnamed protein product [Vitrella brassicaformis CCMP3155]|eukprot:CEM30750.1 unnamed protein product [Vitrella brassicaformis CCMP3155]